MSHQFSVNTINQTIRVILILFLAQSLTVNAQPVLEEVIVTAQKREESVQDVPISITALSGDMISDFGFKIRSRSLIRYRM